MVRSAGWEGQHVVILLLYHTDQTGGPKSGMRPKTLAVALAMMHQVFIYGALKMDPRRRRSSDWHFGFEREDERCNWASEPGLRTGQCQRLFEQTAERFMERTVAVHD